MGIEAHDSCEFDMSVNFQAATDFIHWALSRGGEKMVKSKSQIKASLIEVFLQIEFNVDLILRQGLGALPCGSEPLRNTGPGLLDAEAEPEASGGYLCCKRYPGCYP